MIDYFVRYTSKQGALCWARARSFSKAGVFSQYKHVTYVRKVEKVLSIPETLDYLTKLERNDNRGIA